MANEKRLIDANDRIEKIKQANCVGCENYDGVRCRACWIDDAIGFMEDAHTVDAVEVVRCNDCKNSRPIKETDPYASEYDDGCVWCMAHDVGFGGDDFCSYGERRTNGKDERT